MNYRWDTEIDVAGISEKYTIGSYHRDNSRKDTKPKWEISEDQEVECFIQCIDETWHSNGKGFGIRPDSDLNLTILGYNPNDTDSKIAIFRDDKHGADEWHGYPADYLLHTQDRPSTTILSDWYDKGYIPKDAMAKVRKGLECSL